MATGCFGELLLAEGRDGAPLENESRFAGQASITSSLFFLVFTCVPPGHRRCDPRRYATGVIEE